MASRLQKRMTLRRKLHVLKTLTNSKSVKKSSIIFDAFLHIYKLQLKLEAIKRQYLYLMKHIQEVKVEKVGEEFLVRVTCKKGQDVLVSILEAFEEMGLNVLQASVSCNYFLDIEAIVKAQDQGIDVREITQAVHKAIGKQDGEGTQIV
ncbi:hypothetical protein LOK49_LG09G00951 [Camellia lanceoleosa]|uniref:Uncharacterized protein n=1 Tax=Camellia lanceoleosa TaxID=1840588 RepID=A0ACC0GI80_9ERIC|nr:hypothetical protein LOK49_LG09G00951 [Camellia lanceoleosa]